jgi:hypothetical protein
MSITLVSTRKTLFVLHLDIMPFGNRKCKLLFKKKSSRRLILLVHLKNRTGRTSLKSVVCFKTSTHEVAAAKDHNESRTI